MPVLRQDVTTEEWVIIAEERALRPSAFRQPEAPPPRPASDPHCPFCVGNEAQTPDEVLRYANPDGSWRLRVVPNKFPALVGRGSVERRTNGDLFRYMDGYGVHEVIVESPRHDLQLADMDASQLALILRAYQERYNALKRFQALRFITIFRNHGESAGTSLMHPHSQLIATPVAPQYVRRKFAAAMRFYDSMGKCLYCELARAEAAAESRVVLDTAGFLAFHPYASHSPFETWIMPLAHAASFGMASSAVLDALAGVLGTVLRGLRDALNDPPYNYAIYSSPTENDDDPYYDWHIRIVPRITVPAGFEMGSGMYINTALPEHTAAFMREAIAQSAKAA